MSIIESDAAEPTSSSGIVTGRRVSLVTLVLLAVVFVAFCVERLIGVHGDDANLIDVLVYRAGGHAVLTGHSIYAADFATVDNSPHGLAFTYPPFSALVFVPLALVTAAYAKALIVILNAVAGATFFTVIVVAVLNKWDRLKSWRALIAPISPKAGIVIVAAAVIFVVSVPVQHNMAYGQVNLILAAAIALDILLPSTPWPRGALVGIAVAIKLTPAVFVGYFLVTRQWRALAVSLASIVLATAVGWIAEPSDTVKYLTSTAFHPARIGGLAYASNQSVRGILERIPAADGVRGAIGLVATVLVLALAIGAIEICRRRGDAVGGMLCAAFIGLLCSPVSWGHHWVWLSGAAVYFLMRWISIGGVGNLITGLVVGVGTLAAPWSHLPNGAEQERLWTPLQHLLGSVWALTAFALLGLFATTHAPGRRASRS